MFDWLIPFFVKNYKGITDLANTVRDAIKTAMDMLVGQFVRWAQSAGFMVNAAHYLYDGVVDYVVALRWFAVRMVVLTIPLLISQAVTNVASWASRELAALRQLVNSLYTQALQVARQWVDALTAWTLGQLRVIIDTLNRAVTLLTDVARRVYALLTDPRALSDWIAGHIIQAVFRWILGNGEALARLALQWAIRGALFGAATLEQIITDIWL